VKRFSPLLLASAKYRLGRRLASLYDPEDVVSEVWLVAIPRLPELSPEAERFAPVLLRFLATTLLYRVNSLLRKHVHGKPTREQVHGVRQQGADDSSDTVDRLPARATSALTRLIRKETRNAVHEALERLDPDSREILILRCIEQLAYKDIEVLTGKKERSLTMSYHRALEKLRTALPGSVFDELD
jgi:RNA polymerase sigma factor (sigma-70 family)